MNRSMIRASACFALALTPASGAFAEDAPATCFPDWKGASEYVVPLDQSRDMQIATLCIPKGHTIKFAHDVKDVSWSVLRLRIEEDATIDLTAMQVKPSTAHGGAPPAGQASYCAQGAAGNPGGTGETGQQGIGLNIHDLEGIDNQGSLWIKTDGGPGGDGGAGGKGQQGGGARKNILNKQCGAADGGAGGTGGAAGAGGPASKVTFTLKGSTDGASLFPSGVAPTCGVSARPSGLSGRVGIIQAWGGNGCPGSQGAAGTRGGRG